jgi:hypothetical protein
MLTIYGRTLHTVLRGPNLYIASNFYIYQWQNDKTDEKGQTGNMSGMNDHFLETDDFLNFNSSYAQNA